MTTSTSLFFNPISSINFPILSLPSPIHSYHSNQPNQSNQSNQPNTPNNEHFKIVSINANNSLKKYIDLYIDFILKENIDICFIQEPGPWTSVDQITNLTADSYILYELKSKNLISFSSFNNINRYSLITICRQEISTLIKKSDAFQHIQSLIIHSEISFILLINIYIPHDPIASSETLNNLELIKNKHNLPIVLCGDINSFPDPNLDYFTTSKTKQPTKKNKTKTFKKLNTYLTDTFRHLNPYKKPFSKWIFNTEKSDPKRRKKDENNEHSRELTLEPIIETTHEPTQEPTQVPTLETQTTTSETFSSVHDTEIETEGLSEDELNDLYDEVAETHIRKVLCKKTPTLQHIINVFSTFGEIDHNSTFIRETKEGSIAFIAFLTREGFEKSKEFKETEEWSINLQDKSISKHHASIYYRILIALPKDPLPTPLEVRNAFISDDQIQRIYINVKRSLAVVYLDSAITFFTYMTNNPLYANEREIRPIPSLSSTNDPAFTKLTIEDIPIKTENLKINLLWNKIKGKKNISASPLGRGIIRTANNIPTKRIFFWFKTSEEITKLNGTKFKIINSYINFKTE